jgi:hypothetical protein
MKLREKSPSVESEHLAQRVAQQDAEIALLRLQLAQALERITQLERQLAMARKDSSTSSKPPSSDLAKAAQASATGWPEAPATRAARP